MHLAVPIMDTVQIPYSHFIAYMDPASGQGVYRALEKPVCLHISDLLMDLRIGPWS